MDQTNFASFHGLLAGKRAVVTGAARGIGRACAVAMAQAGADIVGMDICAHVSDILDYPPATPGELDYTGQLVRKAGVNWSGHICDNRDAARVRQVADEVVQSGGYDILFANAGIQGFKPILEMTDADWYDQINTNLNGTYNVLRAFSPHLCAKGDGRIILTSSTQGQHGTKYGSGYSASKWGIIGLAKSAALEFGEYGVTVNTLIPGLIDTALTRHEDRYAQVLYNAGRTPTFDVKTDEQATVQIKTAGTPLGVPWVEPEDVAPIVVFLASDAARMISGSTVAATGGDSANLPN